MDTRRKHNFNQSFLDVIDTPEKAYFLGWAYSDGCNNEKSGSFTLALQERDEDVLHLLNKCLNSSYPLYFSRAKKETHQNQKRLCLNGRYFSKKLKELGVVQNKSLIMDIPIEKFPPNLIKFLIRGWFEGDGHFSWKRKGRSFRAVLNIVCCAPIAIKQLAFLIEKHSGQNIKIYNYKKHSSVKFSSIREVYRFLSWLYSDRVDLCLKRKFESSVNFLETYKETYENGKDRSNKPITDETKVLMTSLRKENKFIAEIAKDAGVANSTVFNFLKKNSLRENLRIKHSINLDRLTPSKDKINSYLLGFLFSKSSLNLGNYTLKISSPDKRRIEFIKDLLENTNPIYYINNTYRLQASGKTLFSILSKIGISGNNNSHYLMTDDILSAIDFKYFLIGMFDARGSFSSRKERREFSLVLRVPQEFLVEKIKNYIFEQTGVVLNIGKKENEMTFLRTCGTNNPKTIIDFLLKDESLFGQFFKEKCSSLI